MRYFIYINNVVTGPLTVEEIKGRLLAGSLTARDKVCPEGTKQWIPVMDAIGASEPGIPGSAIPPPPGIGKPMISDETKAKMRELGAKCASVAKKQVGLARLFMGRVMKSNFMDAHASDEERAELAKATPPVTAPSVQNFLAWRRALLWFSCALLAVVLVNQSKDYVSFLTDKQGMQWPLIVKIWAFFLPVIGLAALVYCIKAVRSWCTPSRTRREAAISYLTQFGGPVLLALFPIYLFMPDMPVTDEMRPLLMKLNEAGIPEHYLLKLPRYLVQAMLALNIVLVLIPKVLGLFPGIVRCSLALKTLMPQHPLPGWLGIAVAPLFSLILAIPALFAIQCGQFVIGIGFVCLVLWPLTMVYWAKSLCAVKTPERMNQTIGAIRKMGKMFFLAGLILICFGARDGLKQIPLSSWFSLGFISFICALFANIFLLTVVCSDLILSAAKSSFDMERELFAGSHGSDLGVRMAELGELLGDGPAPAPPAAPSVSPPAS